MGGAAMTRAAESVPLGMRERYDAVTGIVELALSHVTLGEASRCSCPANYISYRKGAP